MRDDDARLLDMLLAAREAMAFVSGLTFPEFQRNRMAQLAILKVDRDRRRGRVPHRHGDDEGAS